MPDASTESDAPLVLVADDSPAIRRLVTKVLADEGYRTITAADGEEVVDLATRHRPVLIILDVMMPNVDGYTTLVRLRGIPSAKQIPVIILTGRAEPLYRGLSEGIGAVAHLTKPILPRQLTETVRRIIGHTPA